MKTEKILHILGMAIYFVRNSLIVMGGQDPYYRFIQ